MTSSSSKKEKGPSFFGAVRQIGLLTAISRILGFGRDVVLATTIGAGPVADAFFVALKLPNLFRRLTGEGAITNAFLPAYAKARKSGGEVAAAKLAEEIQITLLWGLVVLTVIMEFTMPVVISILAPGFTADDGRYDVAITLARFTIPYLPMISMVAFWAALTNANNRFIGGAAAPIILNIMLMAGAIIGSISASYGAIPVAIAVPVAGIFQMLLMWQMLVAINKKPRWGFWPKISTAGKAMWRKFWAAALGAGGVQLNLLVDTILASLLPVGAISSLYYADRIAQLPLGVIGIALGTALLPRLSRLEAEGKTSDVRAAISRGLRLGLFFSLPAMVGAIVLAEPIIGGLFGYGAFSTFMITPTAEVLMAYALGIPFFVMAKIFQPAFYAADDPQTPLKISAFTVIFNLGASLALMPLLGAVGLALATAVAVMLSVLIMLVILRRRARFDFSGDGTVIKTVIATTVMGVVLYSIKSHVIGMMAGAGFVRDAVSLFVLMMIGIAVFFGVAGFIGALPRDMQRSFRQGG
jgi:putative peptidoglycan lipid II flippase